MSAHVFDPLNLDVQAFAKDAAELGGCWPLATFERIAQALHADAPPAPNDEVAWTARGEQRGRRSEPPQTWLHLHASTRLRLTCQRCLEPVETGLGIDRWFRFVLGEDAAAQIDAESEDDVLALPRALDLRELLEDELLLALPLVPRHAVCAAPLLPAGDGDGEPEPSPNPFAALAALKRGGSLS